MVQRAKNWYVPDKNGLIDQVLGALDPNESCLITFVSGPDDDGGYIVMFDREERFDADSFENGTNIDGLRPLDDEGYKI